MLFRSNALLRNAKIRKESPVRSRKPSASDNMSIASSSSSSLYRRPKKETGIKGRDLNEEDADDDLDAIGSSGLSHIAVSDLATMIQSIKKESLQQMSMSWRGV